MKKKNMLLKDLLIDYVRLYYSDHLIDIEKRMP